MEKIRIAHVAGGLTTGGVEAVVYNYFSHMDTDAYELIYISYDTPEPQVRRRFEELGFTVYSVTKKKENLLKSCIEVYGILKKHRVQVVHSHMTLMCFVTNILGRMAGAKALISHSHLVEYHSGVKKLIAGVFKWLDRWTATDWFACGDDAAVYLFGEKAARSGKVHILNNAIDLSAYRYDAEKARTARELLGAGDAVVIGNVGRFTEQKNQAFALEVFSRFHAMVPESRLLLVGSGPMMEEIQSKAEHMGLSDAVVFTGSDPEPSKYYMAMDAFLFPSTYEGLGIVAVEAQAASLPVLASDVVPRAVVVGDDVEFLSLNEPPEVWAQALDTLVKKHRSSPPDGEALLRAMRNQHYDIDREVDWLHNYYQSCLRRS